MIIMVVMLTKEDGVDGDDCIDDLCGVDDFGGVNIDGFRIYDIGWYSDVDDNSNNNNMMMIIV